MLRPPMTGGCAKQTKSVHGHSPSQQIARIRRVGTYDVGTARLVFRGTTKVMLVDGFVPLQEGSRASRSPLLAGGTDDRSRHQLEEHDGRVAVAPDSLEPDRGVELSGLVAIFNAET